MAVEINHRWTGAVLFTHPGTDLEGADLRGANLRGAYLRGANLGYDDLRGADLRYADLRGADLAGADLESADLEGIDLQCANLRGTKLAGADLGGAKIVCLVARAIRSDGYEFFAWATDKGLIIRAGCRTFNLTEYHEHIAREYPGTPKAQETRDILAFFDARAWHCR